MRRALMSHIQFSPDSNLNTNIGCSASDLRVFALSVRACVDVKVKQSLYGPGVAQSVPGSSQIS